MKVLGRGDQPNLEDFKRHRETMYLVRRVAVIDSEIDTVVLTVLFSGVEEKTFIQAFSLDSWVVTGCYGKDVIKKEQVKRLLELTPRYPANDENWIFLEEKAKIGKLKEFFKRNQEGLGVRQD